jgi:hypothetical protein
MAHEHTSTRATRYSDLCLNRLVWFVGIFSRVSRTRHVPPKAKQKGFRSPRAAVLGPLSLSPNSTLCCRVCTLYVHYHLMLHQSNGGAADGLKHKRMST